MQPPVTENKTPEESVQAWAEAHISIIKAPPFLTCNSNYRSLPLFDRSSATYEGSWVCDR